MRRITWSNIIAVYRVLKEVLREGWERIPEGQSLYNRFVAVNAAESAYALTKTDYRSGACVVAPYKVTQGSIIPVRVDTTSRLRPKTDIALGDLVINANTTVGDLAEAIVTNNDGWEYEDKITFFQLTQYMKDSLPRVLLNYAAITLSEGSTELLNLGANEVGMANVNGFMGYKSDMPTGGCCYIHSRYDTDHNLLLSPQTIICNNDDIIARYTSVEARRAAAESYGATLTDQVILSPADIKQKDVYQFFGVQVLDAEVATLADEDKAILNGIVYGGKSYFDGDKGSAFNTTTYPTVQVVGSNFASLNAESLVANINGTSISSGVTVSGNTVTVTLPNTLNGIVPTRIMLTDGNQTVAMELKS